MTTFTPLSIKVARCKGYTCPQDRDQCRRFAERGLAQVGTSWTNGDRAGHNGACTQHIRLVHLGKGVQNVRPARAAHV